MQSDCRNNGLFFSMCTCVECGASVKNLFTQYSKDNIRLTTCVIKLSNVYNDNINSLIRNNVISLQTNTLNMTLLSYLSTCFFINHKSIAIYYSTE